MSQLVYLSRSFVEFGPFSSEEIQSFQSRGIVGSLDFLRGADSSEWIPLAEWNFTPPTPSPKAEKPKAPAKKAAKKAATKATKKTSKAALDQ